MIPVTAKDCVVNVSIIIAETVSCRPVISRPGWRKPMIDPSAVSFKAVNKQGSPFGSFSNPAVGAAQRQIFFISLEL